MANVVDYLTLGQAILDFTHKDDLKPYLDNFIQSATEQIQNDVFEQNFGNGVRFQEANYPTALPDPTFGTVPVPADFLSPKLFTVTAGQRTFPLIFKSPTWIYDNYSMRAPSGVPAYIARDNSQGNGQAFIFGPYPDSQYPINGTYYQRAPILSAQNTTNWLTANFAWGLTSACMIEAGRFLLDDDMMARWTQAYQARLESLLDADKAERWAASTMQVELG